MSSETSLHSVLLDDENLMVLNNDLDELSSNISSTEYNNVKPLNKYVLCLWIITLLLLLCFIFIYSIIQT